MPMPVKFHETKIPGVLLMEASFFRDDRGFFSEVYSEAVWREAGFNDRFVQDNLSLSKKGTLRGMHYQLIPCGMGKLVRVIQGAIFDVGVDLRQGSPTFAGWAGFTLSGSSDHAVYFPPGFAHGFVALEEDTLVHYKCTSMHAPEAERSLSYRDPKIAIEWPMTPTVISKKDEAAPFFDAADMNFVYDPHHLFR
jgi:dTDP-4-dehydrorhamnose 3,5-epimerase